MQQLNVALIASVGCVAHNRLNQGDIQTISYSNRGTVNDSGGNASNVSDVCNAYNGGNGVFRYRNHYVITIRHS